MLSYQYTLYCFYLKINKAADPAQFTTTCTNWHAECYWVTLILRTT